MNALRILPGWHPIVVHFPLALIVTAAICLTLGRIPAARRYAPTLYLVGTWNWCLGAFAVLLALASGLAAVIDLQAGAAAREAISSHVKSAVLTSVLVMPVALWRSIGVAPASRPSGSFLVIMWMATSSLVITGYRGGQNVYRYGVGVNQPVQPLPEQTEKRGR